MGWQMRGQDDCGAVMPSMRTQRFTWVDIARVGRLVSRVMMEDDDIKLNAVNAGPATTNCMAS